MFNTDIHAFAYGSRRRAWTALLSFLLQCTAVALLVLTPVLFPHVLPRLNAAPPIFNVLVSSEPAPVDRVHSGSRPRTSERIGDTLLQPTRIPTHTLVVDDHNIEPAPAFDTICTNCGPGGSSSREGMNLIAIARPSPPPLAVEHTHRVSAMMEGMLIRRVQPVYPEAAKAMRVQGAVVLQATINKEGRIEHLQAIRGHFLLVQAALDAVRQWRYRPYVLNGEAVEVETQVTVNFVLSGS